MKQAFNRSLFARNVLANWCGHFVFLVAGFVFPRLLSDHMGQSRLGIWDFGWAMVGYLNLLTFGISSSVNSYVALYRAQGREDLLNSAVSSCMAIFLVTGLASFLVTLGVSLTLPIFFADAMGQNMREAQWVILLLGASASLEMPISVYTGVITGSLRYSLSNLIKSGTHLLSVFAMIVLLLHGSGLIALASVMLSVSVLSSLLRAAAAHRVCEGLYISLKVVTRVALHDVVGFGGKTFLLQMSRVGYYQTTNMLITYFLTPADLAMYARPIALLMHALKLVHEFAYVVTPTAAAMQAADEPTLSRHFLCRITQYSFAMSLPIVLFLSILGGPLVRLWMGNSYADSTLVAVLAIGHLAVLTHTGTLAFLGGLNAHGRAAMAILIVSIFGIGMTALALGVLHWRLVGAAITVSVSLTIAYGVFVPVIATRVVGAPFWWYLHETLSKPLLANIPFAVVLVLARYVGGPNYRLTLAVGILGGGLVITVTYWLTLLPEWIKQAVVRRLPLRTNARSKVQLPGAAETVSIVSLEKTE